jgi:hypothetical protein
MPVGSESAEEPAIPAGLLSDFQFLVNMCKQERLISFLGELITISGDDH